jgi:hypothetical protein
MARAETTTRVVIRIGTAWLLRVATAVALRAPCLRLGPKGFSASSKKEKSGERRRRVAGDCFLKNPPTLPELETFHGILDCFSKLD